MIDRSAETAKMLASRARRRVRGATQPPADLERQREVVDAFRAATRDGDFDALFAVLHQRLRSSRMPTPSASAGHWG